MSSDLTLVHAVAPTIDRAVDKATQAVSYPGVVQANWNGTGDVQVLLDVDTGLSSTTTFATVSMPVGALSAGTRVRVSFNGSGRALVDGLIGASSQSGWQDLTLLNGWTAISGLTPRYRIDDIRVWLDGQLTGGAVGTVAARINKAPSQNHTFTAGTHDATNGYGAAVIGVGTDGTITVLSVGSDWVDLGMHSYLTA